MREEEIGMAEQELNVNAEGRLQPEPVINFVLLLPQFCSNDQSDFNAQDCPPSNV